MVKMVEGLPHLPAPILEWYPIGTRYAKLVHGRVVFFGHNGVTGVEQ